MPKYEVWNIWDKMSIDGKKYNSIAKAVEAGRKFLLRFADKGYYACAQRDAINFYGIAEGSTMNAHIPLKHFSVYIVDSEDKANCDDLEDVGMCTLIDVSLPMNPFHDNVVMGGEDCRAVCKLDDDIAADWLFDIVQLWNENRERYYGE